MNCKLYRSRHKIGYSRKKINFILFLLLIFLGFNLSQNYSQKSENYVWYFGVNAGLDFNTGVPVEITDGQINTREGVASICNSSGEIIFYTEGTTVWNRNHQVMPNGNNLEGNFTSTESAVICPAPGFPNKYYIFTAPYTMPDDIDGEWATYSIVDMTLDNNNGDVILKSQDLFPNNSEKIIVTQHANKTDYWIIGHESSGEGTNVFHTALLDANGLHINPQDIEIGIPVKDDWQTTGYLKVSPDGSTLAMALGASSSSSMGYVNILKFNNQTGDILGPSIVLHEDVKFPYGIEFSPDSRFLYVSDLNAWDQPYHDAIFQYDLSVFEENIIKQSMTVIYHVNSNMHYGALQLGPDGKIYVGKEIGYNNPVNHIGVINHPNRKGAYCDYDDQGVVLQQTQTKIGFPTFTGSAGYIKSNPEYACVGDEITLTLNSENNYEVHWFLDGCPQEYTQGVVRSRSATFVVPSVPFTYYAREFNGSSWEPVCYSYIIYEPVDVEIPEVISSKTICYGESVDLGELSSGANLFWFEDVCSDNINIALTPPIVTPLTNSNYYVRRVNCAGMSDCSEAVTITPLDPPVLSLSNATSYTNRINDLLVNFTGDGPWQFSYTINNGSPIYKETSSNPYLLTTSIEGTYEIVSGHGNNSCEASDFGDPIIINKVPTPTIDAISGISCSGNQLNVTTNINLQCNTIDVSEISFSGPENTVFDIMSINCVGCTGDNCMANTFEISFQPSIELNGDYSFALHGDILDEYNLNIPTISKNTSYNECTYIKSNKIDICLGEDVNLEFYSAYSNEIHWYFDGCPDPPIESQVIGQSIHYTSPTVPFTVYAREKIDGAWGDICYSLEIIESTTTDDPEVDNNSLTICAGDNTELFAQTSEQELYWFEGECLSDINLALSSPVVVNPIVNTSYFVRAGNCAGLSNCLQVDVLVNPLPTMSYTPLDYVHECESSEFEIIFAEGTAPWSFKYTIDNGDENIVEAPSSTFTFVIDEPGEYQFYDLTDASECISDQIFDPFVVQEVPCPSVATYYEAECYMDNLTFEINTGIVCSDIVPEDIQIGTPDNSSLNVTDIIVDPACDGLPDATGSVFTIIFDRQVFADGYYPVTINGPITDIYDLTIDEISFTFSLANCGDDVLDCKDCISGFSPLAGEKYILNAWTMEEGNAGLTDVNSQLMLVFEGTGRSFTFTPNGTVIDGWQQINGEFEAPANADAVTVKLVNLSPQKEVYFDDIRIFPVDGTMKSYVYDPVSMKLMAELDENNYATFYEYDEEGRLIRIKRETERGIVTIQENSTHMNAVLNQIRE